MLTGGLIPILILLPNLLWMRFPPVDASGEQDRPPDKLRQLMEILEWAGRIPTLLIPFFYRIEPGTTPQWVALAVIVLSLGFYFTGWARYFLGGRRHALLFQPLAGVPLPLATSPVICFAAASLLFGSWYLGVATAALGVAHVWISWQDGRGQLSTE